MPTRTDHVTLMRGAAAIGAGWQLGDSHHSHADTGASSVGLGLEHRCGVPVGSRPRTAQRDAYHRAGKRRSGGGTAKETVAEVVLIFEVQPSYQPA